MKRIIVFVALLSMFSVLVVVPSAFAGPPTQFRFVSGWQPLPPWEQFYNECNDEYVAINGMVFNELVETIFSSGAAHFQNLQNIRGTGVGLSSGAGYVFSAVQPGLVNIADFNSFEGLAVLNFPGSIQLISLDKDVPDLHISYISHVTVDENNIVRVDFGNFNTLCR